MQTLETKSDREAIAKRISSLAPGDDRKWGRMTVGEMVCHLCDAYRIALGEKAASPATGFFQRTVVKWVALKTPMKWPKGVKTLPELEQGIGGTPPGDFGRDKAELLSIYKRFCGDGASFAPTHPFFGLMSREDWMRWGYLHADHHLRQFGR